MADKMNRPDLQSEADVNFPDQFDEAIEPVHLREHVQNIAESSLNLETDAYLLRLVHSTIRNYLTGDIAYHDDDFRISLEDHAGAFDHDKWKPYLPIKAWETAKIIKAGQYREVTNILYKATTDHETGTWATDLADGKWVKIESGTSNISDDVYSAAWNAVADQGASKNQLYAIIENILESITAITEEDVTFNGNVDFQADATILGDPIATQAYVDDLVTALWKDQGIYDASGDTFPVAADTSPVVAQIKKGFIWTIGTPGTLLDKNEDPIDVEIGDTVRSLIDDPGQLGANWAIGQNNIGYVPENNANKATGFSVVIIFSTLRYRL
jgi:hypothetical protein